MKLQTKFFLALAPFGVISGAFLLASVRRTVHAIVVDDLARRALSLAPELSAQAWPALREGSEQALLPLLQSALDKTRGSYALALDTNGRVVAHTNVVETGKLYRDSWTRRAMALRKPGVQAARSGDKELLDVVIPVWAGNGDFLLSQEAGGRKRAGTIRIGLPLAEADRTSLRIYRRMAIIVLGTGLLMAAIVILLLRRLLRPVRLLADSVARIGRGQFGVTVAMRSSDEIGELAQRFNRMSQGVDRILRSVVDIVIVTDPQGRFRTVNRAALELLGYAEPELLDRPLDAVVQSSGGDLLHRLCQGSLKDLELEVVTKAGQRVSALASGSALTDEGGAIDGFILVAKDLSERRSFETMLAQTERLSAIGRLAGGVAHDFNNILTAISGYSEFLLAALPAGDRNRDDVVEIKKAADRAAALTRQLLAFSRKQVLQPTVVDLNALIVNMEKMLHRLIGEDIEFSSILSPGLWKVKADNGQLEQVIMNLVVNARDAMAGGGRLAIETSNVELKEPRVHPYGRPIPEGRYATFAVSDTGSGMSPEVRSHLFEPFFTTKERGKGTGLGLATVHGIVAQSGGYIDLDTQLGRGSTFRVYLPRLVEGIAPDGTVGEGPTERRGQETILLVEDDAGPREVARRTLEQAGYRVVAAAGASEALRVAQELAGPVHLLLTDIVMPGINGFELGKRFLAVSPKTKVLYMSGYSDHAALQQDRFPTGLPLLPKPFSLHELAARVRRALDG